jgi:hypothetical protein
MTSPAILHMVLIILCLIVGNPHLHAKELQDPIPTIVLPYSSDIASAYKFHFCVRLLKDVIDSTAEKNGPLRIAFAGPVKNQSPEQFFKESDVDISWFEEARFTETNLRRIEVPIFRGILGLRYLLGPKDIPPNSIQSEQDLKKKVLLSGEGWPDTEILRNNGFQVRVKKTKEELEKELQGQAKLLYPRSFLETSYDLNRLKDIALQRDLRIFYPIVMIFYVSPKLDQSIYERLDKGLKEYAKDGRLAAYLDEFFNFDKSLKKVKTTIKLKHKINFPSSDKNKHLWLLHDK